MTAPRRLVSRIEVTPEFYVEVLAFDPGRVSLVLANTPPGTTPRFSAVMLPAEVARQVATALIEHADQAEGPRA